MISYNLGGRLGNIIQEVYTTFYYCRKWNIPFSNIVFKKNNYRFFDLDHIDNGFYIKDNFSFFKNIEQYFNDDIYDKIKNNLKPVKYMQSLQKLDNIQFIHSYRLCGQYFLEMKDNGLFKQLFYNHDYFEQLFEKYEYCNSESLAFSIRRGDFNHIGPYMPLETIEKIITNNNRKYKNIVIFSDDIDWCKKNITCSYGNILFHQNIRPCDDLILMSNCKEIIGTAKSSFHECAIKLKQCQN